MDKKDLLHNIEKEYNLFYESIKQAENIKIYLNELSSKDNNKEINSLIKKYWMKDGMEYYNPAVIFSYYWFIDNMSFIYFCTVFEWFVGNLISYLKDYENSIWIEIVKECKRLSWIKSKLDCLCKIIWLKLDRTKLDKIYEFRNNLVHENSLLNFDTIKKNNKNLWDWIQNNYIYILKNAANTINSSACNYVNK